MKTITFIRNIAAFVALAVALPAAVCGQSLDYNTFINRVMRNNLEYAVAQLDRSVSEADLKAARKFTDPTFSAEYGNNSDWDIMMGQSFSFELGKTISFGKRSARIQVARHNLDATDAGLKQFAFTLRAEATLAYVDALLARDMALVGLENMNNMQSLYYGDSIRNATGDLSEVDVMQSRLEANMASQEYQALRVDYRNALVELSQLMGDTLFTVDTIVGTLAVPAHLFSLDRLLKNADSLRFDIVQQQHLELMAESELKQVRRERMPDIDLALGVNWNSRVRNEEAPAPEYVGYTIGLGIPLPFSNMNRSDVRSSQYKAQQAHLQTDIVRRQARAEIVKAYNSYQSAVSRMSQFSTSIMNDAQLVLQGKIYAYNRGETSLLEVINAQHTYNEMRQSYAECLHQCVTALIELEHSAGLNSFNLE